MRTLLLTVMNLMLAGILAGQAFAQEAGAPPGPSAAANFLPLVVIIAVMYFLIIRPQGKLKKQHELMVKSLKRGDVIITGGGIRGTITRVNDNDRTLDVEIAPGVEVTIVKGTIVELEVRKGESRQPANDIEPGEKKKKK